MPVLCLWFSSSRRQFQIPQVLFLRGDSHYCPVLRCSRSCNGTSTRISAAWLHNIFKTVSNCFSASRLIHSVRRSVSKAVLLSLVTSLVLSRVDYGNATLAGPPARQLCRLQSVLHAAARIVFTARKYDHGTPLLQNYTGFGFRSGSLSSWSPSSSGVLTAQHQCTSPTASIARLTSARGGVCVPARQRRWLFQWLVAARSGIALSRSLLPARGTVYRRLSHHRRLCRLSNDIWRRTCLRPRTDGSADPLVSFSLYRTCRLLCVMCPCSFRTKRHANLIVNNNNNNNNN